MVHLSLGQIRLLLAAGQDDPEMIYDTLADHPDSLLEFVKINFCRTPLHAAAESGHLKFTEEIMRTCPDLAMKHDENGYLASHIAAKSGKYGVLLHMLSVDPNFLHLPSKEGKSVLHLAMEAEHAPDTLFLNILFRKFPTAWTLENNKGETFLHSAFSLQNRSISDKLINFMVERWTVSEDMPYQQRKELLLEKKKVLSLVDNDGNSLLHVACKSSDSSLVEKLVRLGADISACNYEKLYPHQCGSNAIITDLIHQSLLAVTNRQPSYIVSFALKGSLVFRPSLKFNKGLSNTDIALFVVVIAMVISVCALTMATPPGGVLVADYELSKGFYVNGTSTHEDNNGRNLPGKSVLSWTYLTLVWLCNSACFFMSLMFNAILMPTQRKSGFWAALTISFFAGAQYLSWVCAVSYHWLYVAATASELSVVLIFIVGFGYYQDHDAKICEITSSFQNLHGLQMAFNDNRGANFQPVTVSDELEVIRRI